MEAIRERLLKSSKCTPGFWFPKSSRDDGGPVSLNEVSGSGSMFGGTADLFVKVNDLCVAVFLQGSQHFREVNL